MEESSYKSKASRKDFQCLARQADKLSCALAEDNKQVRLKTTVGTFAVCQSFKVFKNPKYVCSKISKSGLLKKKKTILDLVLSYLSGSVCIKQPAQYCCQKRCVFITSTDILSWAILSETKHSFSLLLNVKPNLQWSNFTEEEIIVKNPFGDTSEVLFCETNN